MTRPLHVAIVVLNWNGKQDTEACLESLSKLNYPYFTPIVVDNGSSDQSEEYLRERFPDLIILQTGENLGYAGGNNHGIRYALDHLETDYVWLLNNDTEVGTHALSHLVACLEAHPQVGIVGSRIFYKDQPTVLWFDGGVIHWILGVTSHTGEGLPAEASGVPKKVDYVTGCSLLIRKEVIRQIGLMCEDYFLYFEEVDWNRRTSLAGWQIFLAPESHVWHKVGGASGSHRKDRSPLHDYYDIRNGLIFFSRFNSAFLFAINQFFVLYKIVKKFGRILILPETQKRAKFQAVFWGARDYYAGRYGTMPSRWPQ